MHHKIHAGAFPTAEGSAQMSLPYLRPLCRIILGEEHFKALQHDYSELVGSVVHGREQMTDIHKKCVGHSSVCHTVGRQAPRPVPCLQCGPLTHSCHACRWAALPLGYHCTPPVGWAASCSTLWPTREDRISLRREGGPQCALELLRPTAGAAGCTTSL